MKTHGTIELVNRTWRITTSPHISLRLRRVFERISKAEFGTMSLSATPENTRELAWFLQRYPFEIGAEATAEMERLTDVHRAREAQIELVLEGKYNAAAFELAIPAREYQKQAAAMLLATGRLLLADDVGLGKSCAAIATFCDPRTLPAIVVTMTHLPRQWAAEIGRFAPNLRVHAVTSAKPYDLTMDRLKKGGRKQKVQFPDVIVLSYSKLAGWAETLGQVAKSVVFDECQELRKADNNGFPTKKYAAAMHLSERASFRCGLSATPIYNYGGEMYNVFGVLAPDALGLKVEFGREWCSGSAGADSSIKDPDAFGAYLRSQGLMLRRTRKEVGRELPKLTKSVQHIDSDTEALNAVGDRAAELARIILAHGGMQKGEKLRASEELSWRLRQATGIAKAPYVAAFVRMLVESGEKVLVYAWHHECYEILRDQLKDLPWVPERMKARYPDFPPHPVGPAFYTGLQSERQKNESKRRFVEGDTPVLVMSLRSGAGVDGLQHVCRTVVFAELDWSPQVHEQNIGRVYRDMQTDPVVAYFLLSDEGSDPVVSDVLGLKKQQSDAMLNPGDEDFQPLATTSGQVKRLARAYLEQRGLPVPEAEPDEYDDMPVPAGLPPGPLLEPTPAQVAAAVEVTAQRQLFEG